MRTNRVRHPAEEKRKKKNELLKTEPRSEAAGREYTGTGASVDNKASR